MATIDIPFPLGGQNRAGAFTNQKALTSREMLNTSSLDRTENRVRGCQREGILAYFAAAGSSQVRRMQPVVQNNRRLTYAVTPDNGTTGPLSMFSQDTPNVQSSACVRTDVRGDVYWLDGDGGWVKTNSYGTVLWQQPVEIPNVGSANTLKLTGLWVDSDSSVYVSTGDYTGSIAPAWYQFGGRIWKWKLAPDGVGYVLQWTLKTQNCITTDLVVYQGVLYTLQVDYSVAGSLYTTSVVWYDDIYGGVEPDPSRVNLLGHAVKLGGSAAGNQTIWTHAGDTFALLGRSLALRTLGGIEFIVCGVDVSVATGTAAGAANERRFLCSYGMDGQLNWKLTDANGDVNYGSAAIGTGGIGYGCAVDSTGNIISIGAIGSQAGDNVWIRRIRGTDGNLAAGLCWKVASTFNVTYRFPRFAFDAYDNIYAPYHTQVAAVGATHAVRVFNISGTQLTMVVLWGAYTGTNGPNYALGTAVPPTTPTFLTSDTNKMSEFVYVSALLNGANTNMMHKRKVLTTTGSAGSPRTLLVAACMPPDLKTFTAGGGWVTPTGGAGVFDTNAQYVSSAFLLGKFYASDGLNYVMYDPTPSVATPVTPWTPNSSGVMPPRARLVFAWRARIGIARTPDDPHNFYMSAEGDPRNWDLGPVIDSVSQALAGNLTTAGSIPDLPNSFLPFNDDVLIVFCDHSIWKISGNPLRGGEIDNISTIIGGSFGLCWCVDPVGRVYFHGSRGGIFVMSAESAPERISTEAIDADLDLIDLSQYYIELAWDDALQGLHLFVLPYGTGGTLLQHWRYETRTGAWTPQKYGIPSNTGVQPTAVCLSDGDGDADRRILMAGEDRVIGSFDVASRTDRGTAIYSHALIGPIVLREQSDDRSRLTKLKVTMASNLGGCGLEVFASDVPDFLGAPVWQGEVQPGFNMIRLRARGRYLYLRFWNAQNGRSWAFESASAEVAPAGRVTA